MKTFLAIILLLIPQISFCQTNSSCRETINQSHEKYKLKDYTSASGLFEKAIRDNCSLTSIDYYNGACFAALSKNEKSAFRFLQTSIEMGYEDIDHMNKDTDLDNIRNKEQYKTLLNKIREKYKDLYAQLNGIKSGDFGMAIPYITNGKWGWLNKQTNTPFTKAIFDYTDFQSGSGLFFIYKSKKYTWTNDLTIKNHRESSEGSGPVGFMSDEPAPSDDALVKGFTTDNRTILSFSKRFKNVTLIREYDSQEKIGVAVDSENRKGIIREDGSVFKNFDFNYADIDHFLGRFRNTYFIAKELKSDHYVIYDREGKIVYSAPITSYRHFENYQWTPLQQSIYVGTYYTSFLVIRDNKKENVLDQVTLETLFQKSYDKIMMINGPTSDEDKTGSVGNQGISEPFFLVSEGEQMFYVDKRGKEYRTN